MCENSSKFMWTSGRTLIDVVKLSHGSHWRPFMTPNSRFVWQLLTHLQRWNVLLHTKGGALFKHTHTHIQHTILLYTTCLHIPDSHHLKLFHSPLLLNRPCYHTRPRSESCGSLQAFFVCFHWIHFLYSTMLLKQEMFLFFFLERYVYIDCCKLFKINPVCVQNKKRKDHH